MSLSFEQQLKLELFIRQVEQLTEQEVKNLLVETFKESMLQHTRHTEQLAKHWGIK